MKIMRRISVVFLCLLGVMHESYSNPSIKKTKERWDDSKEWVVNHSPSTGVNVQTRKNAKRGSFIEVEFDFGEGGWAELIKDLRPKMASNRPIYFKIKAKTEADLEIKFSDPDGSVFGRRVSMKNKYKKWTPVVVYQGDTEYWWNGDSKFDGMERFYLAVSGRGRGKIWLDNIGPGKIGMNSSFMRGSYLDPNRKLEGFGTKERRTKKLLPENKLILKWLKQQQDISSPEKQLLSSMEDSIGHTFNNALAALAFILKGEKRRAERILDFFAEATDQKNTDKYKQNFFYNGEARGFYQQIYLKNDKRKAYYAMEGSDRWIGDMAWLFFAYKYHAQKFGGNKYEEIQNLISSLLEEFFIKVGNGGYVGHGWRKDDTKLHEGHGHPEGNIDCYAVFRLLGKEKYATAIKNWLEDNLKSSTLPLDLYSWRVLAYGEDPDDLLDLVEHDLRFRKEVTVKDQKVKGFYSTPKEEVENIWLDGVGHMACSYFAVGRRGRGRYYANQLDSFILDREIKGKKTQALPYAAKSEGEYSWVDVNKGTVSAAAWYLFAKNGFNPMTLKRHKVKGADYKTNKMVK